ncbi:NET1-associated nuclear protein 1 [Coemansia sp. RSA 1807]|nr:NET1-associated nuclear protein 1 [Coemansia sp. RSA 921]KAJ2281924.1 NET1-associated nuclear protein 1 [Coemansia sp. RSA 451]KAJ2534012.1 NET1-associated nuclear protein 1 [Coemansia sp. RSA 1937]KAJ2578019.1 NET1-associated nuclear protein 1 [Coemansia sp. RSA 1807]
MAGKADTARKTKKAGKEAKEPKVKTKEKTIKRPAHLQITKLASVAGSLPTAGLTTPIVEATISTQPTETHLPISLKVVSGGQLTTGPIVFSSDSSQFYLAKDNSVSAYNVQNGEMLQNFSVHRDSGLQRAAIKKIVAAEDHRVYTFSADHKARLWDARTGDLVCVWDIGACADFVEADPSKSGRFFCAMRRKRQRAGAQKKYVVCRVELKGEPNGVEPVHVERQELFRASNVAGLSVRADGQWVAAFAKFRVHVAFVGDANVKCHVWGMEERVSAIAFHPREPVLAVGDWRGRIVFWFCVDEHAASSEDRPIVRSTHHWHAHRVNAIAFSGDSLMLSGGEEGVLVLWQLDTETRDYLPRLGSDIVGISPSPDHMRYAITLRDNTIRIVSAVDRSLVSLLQGLKFAERAGRARGARELDSDPFTTGLVVHPATHALVLNGEPGRLQVFNHANDRHLASIEVAAYNRVGSGSQPHVDLVQFSSDGAWMATIDSRRTDATNGLMSVTTSYLKFWRLDPTSQTYTLVTRIDAPHAGGVHSISFQPCHRRNALLCVSTGRDRLFRVWELQSVLGAGPNERFVWACRATCGYRNMQPTAAAFSSDGSTLAVAFGGAVTLWDPAVCARPVGVLVASADTPQLKGVAFVGASSFVAAWSDERLDVWNMLTGSVWWTLAMPIQSVYVHPRSSLLAVAAYQVPGSSTASVMVLSPSSPTPLLAIQHPSGVEAVALVPTATKLGRGHPNSEHAKPDPLDSNTLVVLTPSGLISVYGAHVDSKNKVVPSMQGRRMESSAFKDIFGMQKPVAAEAPILANAQVRATMRLVRSAVQSSYVNAPFHVLPPVKSLYTQFVTAQLLPVADVSAESEDAATSDVEMDVDESQPEPVWAESIDFFASMRRGFKAN